MCKALLLIVDVAKDVHTKSSPTFLCLICLTVTMLMLYRGYDKSHLQG